VIKVLIISHTSVVTEYRKRFYALSEYKNLDIRVIIPDKWLEMNKWVKYEHYKNDDLFCLKVHKPAVFWKTKPLLNLTYFFPFLYKELNKFKPDIIDIMEEPYSFCAFSTIILNKFLKLNAKIVFFSAQNIYKKYPFPFSFFQNYLFKNADLAFPMTEEVKNVMLKHNYKNKFVKLPLGTDIKENNIKKNNNVLNIGFVGRLELSKGYDLFIKLSKNFNNKQNIKFFIAGSGKDEKIISDICSKNDNLKFEGFLNSEKVNEFYNNMHIIIVPSKTTKNWKEQFGRVIIEAYAHNCIVIGSNSGEIPFVIDNNDFVFEENNFNSLLNCFENTLEIFKDNNKTQNIIKQNFIKLKEKYSWESIAKITYNSYKDILKKGN